MDEATWSWTDCVWLAGEGAPAESPGHLSILQPETTTMHAQNKLYISRFLQAQKGQWVFQTQSCFLKS